MDSLSVTSCGSSAYWDVDSRWVASGLGNPAMEKAAAWSAAEELVDLCCVRALRYVSGI